MATLLNLIVAKAIGLTVPPTLLAIADGLSVSESARARRRVTVERP
jgi:hypothetical protein